MRPTPCDGSQRGRNDGARRCDRLGFAAHLVRVAEQVASPQGEAVIDCGVPPARRQQQHVARALRARKGTSVQRPSIQAGQ
eukprot:4001956-Prymnesium_polylepis.1